MAYTPKDWRTGEVIKETDLDHMEQGIAEAHNLLDNAVTNAQQISNEAIQQIQAIQTQINSDLNTIQQNLDTFTTDIETAVDEKNTTLTNKIAAALGTDYYNNGWTTLTSELLDISGRFHNVESIVGIDVDSSQSVSESIADKITRINNYLGLGAGASSGTLEQQIYNNIGPVLGAAYFTSGGTPMLGSNDSIDARLIELYNGVFGSSSSGSSKSLMEQIQELNTAIFGSADGGSASGSLIDKIETALGRELEPTAEQIAANSNKGYSLLYLIEQIQGILGINGQSASQESDLLTKINNLVAIVNGTEEGDHSLSGLYNDFYNASVTYSMTEKDDDGNETSVQKTETGSVIKLLTSLYSQISSIDSKNTETTNTINNYADDLSAIASTFIDSTTLTFDDKTYLIFKTVNQRSDDYPETLADLQASNFIYVELPAGGTGGGTEYQYSPRITSVSIPDGTAFSIGQNYPVSFIWSVTDSDGNPASISGNVKVRINNVLVYSNDIIAGEQQSLELGSYITTTGRKSISITVTSDVAASRSIYITITAYSASLTLDFDNQQLFTGGTISIPFLASIGSSSVEKTLVVEVDGQPVTVDNNVVTSEIYSTAVISTPSLGAHLLTIYFMAQVNATITLTSAAQQIGIICGNITEPYITTNLVNNSTVTQYDTIPITYMVGSNRTNTNYSVEIIANGVSQTVEVEPFRNYNTTYAANTAGTVVFIFRVAGNTSTQKQYTITVERNTEYVFELAQPQNLVVNLNADNRSNQESGAALITWENQATSDNARDLTVTMSNFLFANDYDGWLMDENNKPFLRLRNTDRVTISSFPVLRQSALSEGLTFEIEFKAHDVADITDDFLVQLNNNDSSADDYYIHVNAQAFNCKSQSESKVQYKEDELITIAYVVNPITNESDVDSGLIYTYVNGILSNIGQYSTILNQATNSNMVIGSSNCTLDLYAIRYYTTALPAKDIVNNWVVGLSNLSEKTAAYNRNNYTDYSLEDYAANSPMTPYMLITANGPLETAAAMPQAKGGDYATTVSLEYHDPTDSSNDFTSTGTTKIQVQGTSSQYYKRKNYKIKMSSFEQGNITHKNKLTADDYNENGSVKSTVTKEGYKLYSTSIPVFSFCLKADYASSEGINNTGLARLYDDVAKNFFLTAPQENDSNIRQAVDGKPILVFYQDATRVENGGNPYFLGKYNFNNDKGTHEIFGLTTYQENYTIDEKNKVATLNGKEYIGDQSWEGADNFIPLDVFNPNTTIYDSNGNVLSEQEKWTQAWPARFPGDWEDYPNVADYTAFKEAVEWVYSTRTIVLKQNEDKTWYDAGAVSTDADYVGPSGGKTRDEVLAEHLEKFKNEFSNYFDFQAMLFFYVFTEFFLMIDNRAKNMFMTRYLTTANRDGTTVLTIAADEQTYGGWFTLPYDFDTAMGINNEGRYEFDYYWEDNGELQSNGALVFNGQPSILWTNFRQAFADEIRAEYRTLLGTSAYGFNYDTIEQRFEDHQEKWSETVFNEDARFKYILPKTNYFMAQGSKKEQRKWWLYNRFRYMSSKYLAGQVASDNINMRADANGAITVLPYADCYLSLEYGSNFINVTTRRSINGAGVDLSVPSSGGSNDAVVNLYPASAIKEIRGLASCKLKNIDLTNAEKLQSLQIGSPDTSIDNNSLDTITISSNNILRHIDLRNCSSYTSQLNLTSCTNLETCYLAGTGMTSVGLPDGGILKTIQYPVNTSSIVIRNQPYLQNVIIGATLPSDEITTADRTAGVTTFTSEHNNNYSKIQNVYLINTGSTFDSLDLVTRMGGSAAADTLHLYLEGVEWEADATEFQTLYYNKLQYMKGYNSEGSVSDSIDASISGTLILTGTYTSDFVNEIANKYQGKLQIYYREDGELKQFYAVRFYDSQAKVNLLRTEFVAGGTVTGGIATYNITDLFTEEYIVSYNESRGWTNGEETRWGAKEWEWVDANGETQHGQLVSGVTEEVEAYPNLIPQYCLNQIVQKENYSTDTVYSYFYSGEDISVLDAAPYIFIRDYYSFTIKYWTATAVDYTEHPNIDDSYNPTNIGAMTKAAYRETIYAVYDKNPATYAVTIYNTDKTGAASTALAAPFYRAVKTSSTSGISTIITRSDVLGQLGISSTSELRIVGDEGVTDSLYQFNNWKPYIPEEGLIVTGPMNIYATYYKTDDVFNCYFLNKLFKCDLVALGSAAGQTITSFPAGAFNQNTNLMALKTAVTTVGEASFVNINEITLSTSDSNYMTKRVFIFTGNNVTFGQGCFYNAKDSIIIFTGTGQITVSERCFAALSNCDIVVPNSELPIRSTSSANASSAFGSFVTASTSNQNRLYVKSNDVRVKYQGGDSQDLLVPSAFKDNEANPKVSSAVQVFSSTSDAGKEILRIVEEEAKFTL